MRTIRLNHLRIIKIIKDEQIRLLNEKFEDRVNLNFLKRALGLEYSYLHLAVKQLEQTKYVYTKKKGRNKYLYLTGKGERLTKGINKYIDFFEEIGGTKK